MLYKSIPRPKNREIPLVADHTTWYTTHIPRAQAGDDVDGHPTQN